MADFYKVLKADPLGEPWTPNKPGAKPIQNYWCQVDGQELPVSIGRQEGNPLHPGQHVYGDLVFTKSQKGNTYLKFKSAQVPDDVTRPTDDPSTPAQATAQQAVGADVSAPLPAGITPLVNQVKSIEQKLDWVIEWCKNMGNEEVTAQANEAIADAETVVDPQTQATIDKLFGDE